MRAITFEENDNLKLYRNALTGATSARGMLHVIMDIFTLYIPYFLTIIFYLAKQDASLLAIVPLVAIPIFITNQIKKKNYQRLHKHTIHPKRKKEEYTKYRFLRKFVSRRRSGSFMENICAQGQNTTNFVCPQMIKNSC